MVCRPRRHIFTTTCALFAGSPGAFSPPLYNLIRGHLVFQCSAKGGTPRLSINLTEILRTFGRFVGNGLDRSVQPNQQHDIP